MNAIILAAGRGERLGEAAGGRPKCLLRFGGKTLLQRHIEILNGLGAQRIIIVTGYRHRDIGAELATVRSGAPVETIVNPDYEAGSVVSLHCAYDHLDGGADSIMMDADVLYEPGILARLFSTQHDNCFLLDREFEPGDEPVKLCVSGAHTGGIQKKAGPGDSLGFPG